jgi:hypothetical protein
VPDKNALILKPNELKYDKLYRGVAYYWIVDGVLAMLVGLEILPGWASGLGGMLFNYLGAAVTTGFLISILGVGMLTRVQMARWLVGGVLLVSRDPWAQRNWYRPPIWRL